MRYIIWFKDITKDSIAEAGGKGANLGEMANAKLPVPGGFVVTAQAYSRFLEETGIQKQIMDVLSGLDVEDNEKLQAASKRIGEIVIGAEIPPDIMEPIMEAYSNLGAGKDADSMINPSEVFVAVRSSATAEDLPDASFAGQQATFLNIRGNLLVQAVRKCWASLFTARAIYYRVKNNFEHEKVLIAVVVQRMVNSDKSGVMFTVNPATNAEDEIVIEAVHGLGETIVSGSVNPDLYIVNKSDLSMKKKELRKQGWGLFRDENGNNVKRKISDEGQIIDDKLVYGIALLGKKIETHYKKPMDIEWAIENGEIYIVQARAVTTLKERKNEEYEVRDMEVLLKGETASGGIAAGRVKLVNDPSQLDKVKKGDIMVAVMTTPDMVPAMQRAAGIVTDEGGITCHAAIVSREMGIPCIVGTNDATKFLKDNQEVTVHATKGLVYNGIVELKDEKKEVAAAGGEIVTATKIKVVMDLPKFASKVSHASGVGLVRLEIMIANGGVHPAQYVRENRTEEYTKLLVDGIREIAQVFKDKPVWVRNSDIRTDEYRNLKGGEQEPKETDPMIGWHAIRRLLDEPQILRAEMEAIKQLHDEGLTNVGVMLPFVIRTDEVRKARKIMQEVGLKEIMFGVMIETPASCWIIEDLCKEGIDFISFGTNDLTQLTLGIDRNNQRLSPLFDEMHPAVLGEITKVIKTCRKYGVQTSICGQAGSRPQMAKFLVEQGIDSISVAPDAIENIKMTVAAAERKIILDAAR